MKTNLDLARTVSGLVELRSINLKSASVESTVDPYVELPPELVFSQQYRASHEVPEAYPDKLNVIVELHLSAGPPESEIETVDLTAKFLLAYHLQKPSAHDEAALSAFAELNGPYHAWPYWRELVHTVTGRIGLSPFLVPVLKLPVKKLPKEGEPEDGGPPPESPRTRKRRRN